MFIYTDGIPEAMNSENDEYGEDRLVTFIKQNHTSRDFSERLKAEILNFTDGKLSDDITALLVHHVNQKKYVHY
jgi:serine phosphatase RsbU (regulator of sigma subunit)